MGVTIVEVDIVLAGGGTPRIGGEDGALVPERWIRVDPNATRNLPADDARLGVTVVDGGARRTAAAAGHR